MRDEGDIQGEMITEKIRTIPGSIGQAKTEMKVGKKVEKTSNGNAETETEMEIETEEEAETEIANVDKLLLSAEDELFCGNYPDKIEEIKKREEERERKEERETRRER